MEKDAVKSAVEEFYIRYAYGNSSADCFPPWYLHQMYQVPEIDSMRQSSGNAEDVSGIRGYDFGIDAFHLEEQDSKPAKLIIIQVTINNNRQNSISPSALRANDEPQLKLEERFRKVKIFYQRQKGAYENIKGRNPEIIENEYTNSLDGYVDIEDLARSIAAAFGEISLARHPNDIFESEKAYNRIFSEKRLASITFLTFLQNLHDVIFVVLKKDMGFDQDENGHKPGSLGYYSMCLLLRYLAKEEEFEKIHEFGHNLWGRHKQFRLYISRTLDNRHSGIKGEIDEKFLDIEDKSEVSLKGAFERAQNSLRLGNNIDVFEKFKNLDNDQDNQGD